MATGDRGWVGMTGGRQAEGVVKTLEHGKDVSSCSTEAAEAC